VLNVAFERALMCKSPLLEKMYMWCQLTHSMTDFLNDLTWHLIYLGGIVIHMKMAIFSILVSSQTRMNLYFLGDGRKTNIFVCASFMLIVSSIHRQIPTGKREIALPFFYLPCS
jgi:hypothetical protein